MKTIIDIEKTPEFFTLQRAVLISNVAFQQERKAYNDIFMLMFQAQGVPEEKIIETPHGGHFYHKDGEVYERQFFNDKKMPYGDFSIIGEALTEEKYLYDLYEYLSGGEFPSLFGFTADNRYSLALIDNKFIK